MPAAVPATKSTLGSTTTSSAISAAPQRTPARNQETTKVERTKNGNPKVGGCEGA